ncbi:hypothetical protein [Candidatus Proelusimicrobium excrementi]|uniref:hypothetical protein n=1 Tax=Candidatus Proelusimicrobium excrementi TaxID=3416222 RepID=UPI003D13348F
MKIYSNTQSIDAPKEFEINSYRVFVAKNIKYVEKEDSENTDEESITFSHYEFDLYEYTPSEYIEILKNANEELNNEILDTQMALCEIYETMGSLG